MNTKTWCDVIRKNPEKQGATTMNQPPYDAQWPEVVISDWKDPEDLGKQFKIILNRIGIFCEEINDTGSDDIIFIVSNNKLPTDDDSLYDIFNKVMGIQYEE